MVFGDPAAGLSEPSSGGKRKATQAGSLLISWPAGIRRCSFAVFPQPLLADFHDVANLRLDEFLQRVEGRASRGRVAPVVNQATYQLQTKPR